MTHTTRPTYADIIASPRYAALCTALSTHDHGDGGLGIIVAHALADDPRVTLAEVTAIVLATEADAAADAN